MGRFSRLIVSKQLKLHDALYVAEKEIQNADLNSFCFYFLNIGSNDFVSNFNYIALENPQLLILL